MSTKTTNLQLEKPTMDEYYNLSVWNNNMDKIDGAFNSTSNTVQFGTSKAGEHYCTTTVLNLGQYASLGYLTSSGGYFCFSIPTGRVFPTGTTITDLEFDIIARSGSSNGSGMYIIKKTSGGSDTTHFKYSNSTVLDFYDGANNHRTLTTKPYISLNGGTNIWFGVNTGVNYYFPGNATNTGYANNQPVAVYLDAIKVTLSIPT